MTGPRAIKCPRCGERKEKLSRNYCDPCQQKYGPDMKKISESAKEVLAERQRQKEKEGWTEAHDDKHDFGELARAAACYAMNAGQGIGSGATIPVGWPWSNKWWKPKTPRADLIRAGALILAEIERLDRISVAAPEKGEG